jgi:hypothetical protein
MRKMLLLAAVVVVASSATGCNCCRNACGGGGGGLFGFGLLGHRQPAYAQAPACCPQPVVCCPQPVVCCDPCADGGHVGGAMVGSPMVSDGGSCCN